MAGYARRVEESESDLQQLKKEGFDPTRQYRSLTNMLPNGLQSDQAQRYDQAQRNFVNAVMRPESGAAISESEFDNARKQYFPQPGDSANVVMQKEANRAAKLASLKASSGPAYAAIPLITPQNMGQVNAASSGVGPMGTANAGPSGAPGSDLQKGPDGKFYKTSASGDKKEVVKAFRDKSDGKIHYKYADGTVE